MGPLQAAGHLAQEAPAGAAEEKAAAFESCLSYCGTFDVADGRVIHRPEHCTFPNWVGAEMTRTCRFENGRAYVTTLPITDNGKTFVFELVLKRAS